MSYQKLADLPESIRQLIHSLENETEMKPAAAAGFLRKCSLSLADVLPYASFDHPAEESYGRCPIWDGGNYKILVMSWLPGDFTMPHDHGGAEWGAVKTFGPMANDLYVEKSESVVCVKKEILETGSVIAVNSDLIHRSGNHGRKNLLSLHIYGQTKNCESATYGARLFNFVSGEVEYSAGSAFYNMPAEKLLEVKTGKPGDLLSREDAFCTALFHARRAAAVGKFAGRTPLEKLQELAAAWTAGRFNFLPFD